MRQQQLFSRAKIHEGGVKVGYVHLWKYRGRWIEKKISPKTWQFRFRATKNKINGTGHGGPPKGFGIRWKIVAIQDAVKVGNKTYLTDMRGYKQQVAVQQHVNIPTKLNSTGGIKMAKRMKVYKSRRGTLTKYTRSGVKLYYNKKLHRWVPSRYQGKGNKAGWSARGKHGYRGRRSYWKQRGRGNARGLRNLF